MAPYSYTCILTCICTWSTSSPPNKYTCSTFAETCQQTTPSVGLAQAVRAPNSLDTCIVILYVPYYHAQVHMVCYTHTLEVCIIYTPQSQACTLKKAKYTGYIHTDIPVHLCVHVNVQSHIYTYVHFTAHDKQIATRMVIVHVHPKLKGGTKLLIFHVTF